MKYNYILTYPRTGSSLIRYCVEKITKRPTLDCGGEIDMITGYLLNGPAVLRKEHFVGYLSHNNINKLILSLRNYKDVFISHNVRDTNLSDSDKIYHFLCHDSLNGVDSLLFYRSYYDLINFYDKFKGEKMIVYYEDLIDDNLIIKDVINFLLPENNFKINKELLDKLSNESKSSYTNKQGSRTDELKILHEIFSDEQNNKLDNKFKNYNENLFNKYLTRYLKNNIK